MTEFELVVWASVYGAEWAGARDSGMVERQQAGQAFEAATYAVQELRRTKIEPIFGPQCGASSDIEAAVHGALSKKEVKG